MDDITVVRELDAPNRIVLEAKLRPLLIARVTLSLEPLPGGTLITMEELPIGGAVGRLGGLLDRALHLRNSRALQRLEAEVADEDAKRHARRITDPAR
jgi:hypothetical protein